MNKASFERVLADISVFADQVMISSSKDGVSFSGRSDVGGVVVQLGRDSAEILELVPKDGGGDISHRHSLYSKRRIICHS